jgi:EpsI family protein
MTHLRLATAIVLVGLTAGFAQVARLRAAPPPIAIEGLPLAIDNWRGHDVGALDAETVRILRADAYLNRSYSGGAAPLGLYVAYYADQRPGVSIHSPLHCLPGTGWEPLDVGVREVSGADGRSGSLSRMVVRKGRDRAVVLYWYAVHGRMIGSELISKAWLLHDSIRFNRRDAALVRIVVPVTDSVDAAERAGITFANLLSPRVAALWN